MDVGMDVLQFRDHVMTIEENAERLRHDLRLARRLVPNLFVTDASAFPTSGTAGTTLTIMALTVRACEHIAAEYGAGRL